MSILFWLVPLVKQALTTLGLAAAKKLCEKYMGDNTCLGFLPN